MSIAALAAACAAPDGADPGLRGTVALHVADALAALVGGLATREGAALARLYAGDDLASRAAAAAAVIRFTECDAIRVPTCVTPAAVVIPVALLFAADAAGLVRGVEAGYAVGGALAAAVGGAAALAHGVWPTLLAAPAMAAAAAAAARGLDEGTTRGAIALALAGCSGRAGRPGGWPSGRWVAIGAATRTGVAAALAAMAGARGDPDLLSTDWLAAQAPAGLEDAGALVALPGAAVAAVGFKPYVAARQGQNAIEALRRLLARGLDPAAIRALTVALPPDAIGVVGRPLDVRDRLSGIAHLGVQLGLAAFTPGRLLDIGREAPYDPRVLDLAARVSIVPDATLSGGATWPARVAVDVDGGPLEVRCDALPGDVGYVGEDTAAQVVRVKIATFCAERVAAPLRRLAAGDLGDALLPLLVPLLDTTPRRARTVTGTAG